MVRLVHAGLCPVTDPRNLDTAKGQFPLSVSSKGSALFNVSSQTVAEQSEPECTQIRARAHTHTHAIQSGLIYNRNGQASVKQQHRTREQNRCRGQAEDADHSNLQVRPQATVNYQRLNLGVQGFKSDGKDGRRQISRKKHHPDPKKGEVQDRCRGPTKTMFLRSFPALES